VTVSSAFMICEVIGGGAASRSCIEMKEFGTSDLWCSRLRYAVQKGTYPGLARKGDFMPDKCANPSCNQIFRYSRSGTLFFFEPNVCSTSRDRKFLESSDSVEPFWLCEQCATSMTIISDRGESPVIVSLLADESQQIGTA
jgi:hypothetical protein